MDLDMQEIMELCRRQEAQYQFTTFSRADALALGLKLTENAKGFAQGVAVRIVMNGLTVFQYLPEGAEMNNAIWMDRKIRTVTQFGHASLYVMAELGGDPTDQKLDANQYALCGGGFPLIVRGVGMVGVITVSGLPHLDDHQLIISTLAEWFA